MPSGGPEAQTIRRLVIPRLESAGWLDDQRSKEHPIAARQLTVADGHVREGKELRADIALLHGEHPIAVVEAKKSQASVHDGIQQAREYAERLDVPVAYATNGHQIVEIDMRTGAEKYVDRFRAPAELWAHFRAAEGLTTDLASAFFTTPYSRAVPDVTGRPKIMRYYQHVATQRLLRGIADGVKRLLVVLATGTGKTAVAAQLVHILWQNHWPRGAAGSDSRPRVLYLADRDVLVTQPIREWFTPIFGEDPIERVKGRARTSPHLYFALYQALDSGDDQAELFRSYPRDWFDLVIVDECHRGSAAADSAWRDVLDYFDSAVQIGLTATPVFRGKGNVDTYGYFGEPVYEYSLAQGIADGFLAPFEVLRVRLDRDLDGVDIPEGTTSREGSEVEARHYGMSEFERRLVLPERTETMARYLTDFLRGTHVVRGFTPELRKTIVFCVNSDHAGDMRMAMVNLNGDLLDRYGQFWAARIVADEGERGRALLDDFCQETERVPTVVTTSQMLSTGVDVPTAHVIVLARPIGSMTEFKQIIGRGTRLAKDFGKEYFTIIDFVGATTKFNDPEFDGPPIRIIQQDATDSEPPEPPVEEPAFIDEREPAEEPGASEVHEPEPPYESPGGGSVIGDPGTVDIIRRRSDRQTVDGYEVCIDSEALYIFDPQARQMRMIRYEHWVRDRVRTLDMDEPSLRRKWATMSGRAALRELLSETIAFDIDSLAKKLHRPECDPIDLLCALGWDVPLMTRADRAARFTREERAFLDGYSSRARQVLSTIVDKYAAHGVAELDPKTLLTPPLSELGSPADLAAEFGGHKGFHQAIDALGARLFEAA